MRKLDYLFFILLSLFFISVVTMIVVYAKDEINECTSNPLVYGAKQESDLYKTPDVYGSLIILKSGYLPTYIEFNTKEKKEKKV